jgi:hypothetical protein
VVASAGTADTQASASTLNEARRRLSALRRDSQRSAAGSATAWHRAQDARMDTDEINAIGTLLADLSQRTQPLRGYL